MWVGKGWQGKSRKVGKCLVWDLVLASQMFHRRIPSPVGRSCVNHGAEHGLLRWYFRNIWGIYVGGQKSPGAHHPPVGCGKVSWEFWEPKKDADVVSDLVEMGRLLSVGISGRRCWWGPVNATVSGILIHKGLDFPWATDSKDLEGGFCLKPHLLLPWR